MIYIFGDSYAYSGKNNYDCFEYKGWHQYFEEPVKNFSVPFTGPQHSMDALNENIMKLKDSDKIIFILSYPERLNFFSSKPEQSRDIARFMLNNEYDDLPYVQLHYDNINYLYLTLKKEFEYINLKNLLYLKHISDIMKMKVFVISVPRIYYKVEYLNNSNFFHFDNIESISFNEINKYDSKMNYKNDKRINHLSEKNNKNLFNIIDSFFKEDTQQMNDFINNFETSIYEKSEIF